jgi:hypothetical protein
MSDIPDHVLAFIRERIDSIEQIEVLLLLKNNAAKEWTAEEVSRALSTQPDSAASRLADFHSQGIVAMKVTPGKTYRYQANTLLDATIRDLGEAYSKYPVRVISLIYAKPTDKIRTFADAFKLRKEPE